MIDVPQIREGEVPGGPGVVEGLFLGPEEGEEPLEIETN
jgi:hypothetical protein